MDLKEWIKEKGWSKTEFAKRLGICRTTTYQWFNGKKPSTKIAKRLEKLTKGKIKVRDWKNKKNM